MSDMKRNESVRRTEARLTAGVVTIIILSFCLAITTFALVYATVSVDDNIFITGNVGLDLNGGEPVIREGEFLFEPGMTVKKDFYLKNLSSTDVYYRLYFQNVSGGLAEYLTVSISLGERELYRGSASELTRENVAAADDILKLGEEREFQITFYFPPEVGNEAQALGLSFDLAAEAVQVKNNPDRVFD